MVVNTIDKLQFLSFSWLNSDWVIKQGRQMEVVKVQFVIFTNIS